MKPPPPAPQRGFPVHEFETRLDKVQHAMAEATLEALLLTTEADIRYFSGFLTPFWQSPTRPWFLVVPLHGKPIAVIPTIGAECMGRTWIEDIRTWSSPNPVDDGVSLLGATLQEIAGTHGTIGLPMGAETHVRMPLNDLERLRKACPSLNMQDASGIVRQIRMVKSDLEVEKIAHVCGLVSDVFEALPSFIEAGMSEAVAMRAFKIECLKHGVDDISYLVGGAEAGGYGDIISPPKTRAIATGDVLILDTGCVFDGYFCDFDRNYAFGSATDAARKAYDSVYRATEAGLAAVRPGATCADLFHAMQAVMEKEGALGNDVGRMGHGLGMQLTEPPSHTAWDQTVLQVGMVLTLEPGMCFASGKIMVHEENLVVCEEGPQLLSRRASPELPII